jgi:hypothetical protein
MPRSFQIGKRRADFGQDVEVRAVLQRPTLSTRLRRFPAVFGSLGRANRPPKLLTSEVLYQLSYVGEAPRLATFPALGQPAAGVCQLFVSSWRHGPIRSNPFGSAQAFPVRSISQLGEKWHY